MSFIKTIAITAILFTFASPAFGETVTAESRQSTTNRLIQESKKRLEYLKKQQEVKESERLNHLRRLKQESEERIAKSVRDGWEAYKIPAAETAKSDALTIQTASSAEEAVVEVKEAADEEEAEAQAQPALSAKFVKKSEHGLALNVSFRNSRDELVPRHLVRDEQIRQKYLSFLMDACLRHGVPPVLSAVVIRVESSWDREAISEQGAISLSQLMPETALDLGVDPHNPKENIAGGVEFLASLLKKFDNDVELALASYNCGYDRVSKLLKKHGRKSVVRYLPKETQQYLWKIKQVVSIKTIDI